MDKLAVSNIAWTNNEEPLIAQKLAEMNVHNIEIAPTKIWKDPTKISDQEIEKNLKFWKSKGLCVIAFQSMLFGRENLQIFKDKENRLQTQKFLEDFIILSGKMGAKVMVFGSPKNRVVGDMDFNETQEIAIEFFGKLGDVAYANNVVFCIEPNPKDYNCDFITTAQEGADLVRAVNNPGFGLHLDIAGMTLAGDDIARSIENFSDILRHFHISSPFLDQVNSQSKIDHSIAAKALKKINYEGFFSIEMRSGEEGQNVDRVKEAVDFVKEEYWSM